MVWTREFEVAYIKNWRIRSLSIIWGWIVRTYTQSRQVLHQRIIIIDLTTQLEAWKAPTHWLFNFFFLNLL